MGRIKPALRELKRKNLLLTEELISTGKLPDNQINDSFSGIVILSNLNNFVWKWLPGDFIEKYDMNIEEDKNLSMVEFSLKYLHPFSIIPYAAHIIKSRLAREEKIFEIVEYARPNPKLPYEWWHKTTKFSKKNNCIVSIVHKINDVSSDMNAEDNVFEEQTFLEENADKFTQLTSRQKEVLRFLALGYTNKEIAKEINISPNTVRTYRNQIHRVLDLRWKNINHSQYYMKYASSFGLIN